MERRGTTSFERTLRQVLLLSILTFGVLIYLIFKNISIKRLIKSLHPVWFLLLFVNTGVVILLNGLKFKSIVKSLKSDISYTEALKIVLSSVFASSITPYYSGGIVTQVYLLRKTKTDFTSSTLVSISYTILTVIVSLIFAIVFFILPHPFLKGVRGTLLLSIIILAFALSSIMLFLMAHPEKTKRFVKFVVRVLRLRIDETQIVLEVDAFSDGLKFMLKNPVNLLKLVLISFTSQLLYEMIGLTSLKAIGISFNFYEAFLTQIASNFIAAVGVTPGGMGIVEGSYLLLFIPIAHHFAPLQTFLFRMFSYYIPSLVGAFVFYKTLGNHGKEILYK
ncbi:MAG: lysylphosphatidylglycerol synthase transmembrane domain-containing protein [Caldisericaceae bacterium]